MWDDRYWIYANGKWRLYHYGKGVGAGAAEIVFDNLTYHLKTLRRDGAPVYALRHADIPMDEVDVPEDPMSDASPSEPTAAGSGDVDTGELDNCPFCGEPCGWLVVWDDNRVYLVGAHDDDCLYHEQDAHEIVLTDAECEAESLDDDTQAEIAEATAKWNHRAPAAELRAEVERLRALVEAAYREGYVDGVLADREYIDAADLSREHWEDSDAYAALSPRHAPTGGAT